MVVAPRLKDVRVWSSSQELGLRTLTLVIYAGATSQGQQV